MEFQLTPCAMIEIKIKKSCFNVLANVNLVSVIGAYLFVFDNPLNSIY